MASGVWIIAEQRDGRLRKTAYELLGKGRELADQLGQELAALLLGYQVEGLAATLGQYGADKVYVADSEMLKLYSSEGYSRVIADLAKEYQPSIILAGATAMGKDLAPRVAAKLQAGVGSDCTALELDGDRLVMTRPIYAGKAQTKVVSRTTPQMATVRPNVMPPAEADPARKAEIIRVVPNVEASDIRARVVEVQESGGDKVELTEADIIVSGGRGMKGPENYAIIEELAGLLGAAVGASRAAVDAGWRPHSDQVGQTGKVVSPNLYIACGISGAMQHLAGMSSSKVIVAINKDPEAPIFKVADYGVVGDLFKVVPALTEEVRKLRQE